MSTPLPPSPLWESVKQKLSTLFSADIHELWFAPLKCVAATDKCLTLGVSSDFDLIWIHDNYLDLIRQHLHAIAGHEMEVRLQKVDGAPAKSIRLPDPVRPPARTTRRARSAEPVGTSYLNPSYTFDMFVVGDNNQVAQGAALAVTQEPGEAYNPLFLHGNTGLGKTHLMHAIGHAIVQHRPHAKVAYLSTEKFTNEFIQGLQENAMPRFRERYRNVDVLLLDDVQFLEKKERIQEEVFHTFNDLFGSNKQIVLSSDRRAADIPTLQSRLISRFSWGLSADLQSPALETREAILRSKARHLEPEIPSDVITFIAENISKNIRLLESALIKVGSFARFKRCPLDVKIAKELLSEELMEQARNIMRIETIQKCVVEHFQIRLADMTSRRRPANIAFPRQIAMYLSRALTRHSLKEIGEAFGGRDHGTVIHACRTVENLMTQEKATRTRIDFLRKELSR